MHDQASGMSSTPAGAADKAAAKQLYYKEWYAKNKLKRQAQGCAQVREWQRHNRNRVLEHKRRYREKHREVEVVRRKKYFEENRDKILERARQYRRRAKLNKVEDKDHTGVPCHSPVPLKLRLSFILC